MFKEAINDLVKVVKRWLNPPIYVVDPRREQNRYVDIEELSRSWPELTHQQVDLLSKFLHTEPDIKDSDDILRAKAGAHSVVVRLHALVDRQKSYKGEATITNTGI